MTKDELLILRRSLNMSQAAFGKALGVSRIAVGNWERGTYSVPDDIVTRMASHKVGPLSPVLSHEDKERAEIARRYAAEYAKLRKPPFDLSHAAIVASWIKHGYMLKCPREALAQIAAEWPDILETTSN